MLLSSCSGYEYRAQSPMPILVARQSWLWCYLHLLALPAGMSGSCLSLVSLIVRDMQGQTAPDGRPRPINPNMYGILPAAEKNYVMIGSRIHARRVHNYLRGTQMIVSSLQQQAIRLDAPVCAIVAKDHRRLHQLFCIQNIAHQLRISAATLSKKQHCPDYHHNLH